MSIQLVTFLLRLLCDKYAESEDGQKQIYQLRKFLDQAFSQCENSIGDSELKDIVNGINNEFFDCLKCYDEKINFKAFLFYGTKKFFHPFNL